MLLFYKGSLKLGKQVQHNYVILYLEISIQDICITNLTETRPLPFVWYLG